MFHEYNSVPQWFDDLQKKIRTQDSQLRIPRVILAERHEGKRQFPVQKKLRATIAHRNRQGPLQVCLN
jgi:hypothetical protein